eukprot:gnl/TRDRNA2_/TRDRNA2_55078_c0_seq1.p1 gnl/TRDRNA2_/TRDRNA2_55078_c0~~gnl/TRDRNA2_/TRDRNA2_55078_c0_seq1.p1  ORF type:complete len:148 (+),score=28.00 gnl/TRDRNA2_/TRDRNA2_55078_c0_seq1:111-554(+)
MFFDNLRNVRIVEPDNHDELFFPTISDAKGEDSTAALGVCSFWLKSARLSSFSLKNEALRIFQMANKNEDGKLDMSELAEMWHLDSDEDIILWGKLSQAEWLAYVKKLADKNEKSAAALLRAYEKKIATSNSRLGHRRRARPCASSR